MIKKLYTPPVCALAWSELRCQNGVDCKTGSVWVPANTSAILGISQRPGQELNLEACRESGVAIVRRQSGGGAVILDASVLCFEFFAPAGESFRELSIRESFRVLTEPVCTAVEKHTGLRPVMAGISDLALERGGILRKICGCAQMRKRQAVLVHGSILVNTDPALLERLLAWPSETPDYRQQRSHKEFCLPLCVASGKPVDILQLAQTIYEECTGSGWAWDEIPPTPTDEMRSLIASKYGTDRWNLDRLRSAEHSDRAAGNGR